MSLSSKWKEFAASPNGQKAGAMFKKTETKVWNVLEPIGRGANRLAGKAGAEAFWPTELAQGEIEKAARILRTFTLDGVEADGDQAAEQNGGVSAGPSAAAASKDKYAARKTQKVIKKIPPKALQGACGIAIMTCFRSGFGISGASGSGVVLARLPDGSWGPPSGILIHTLGWGFLIGVDIYDCVLILRTPQALKAFDHAKLSIGAELGVTAGPVGNGLALETGVQASPCWSYVKSKGAYAGLQLDGTIILKRDDANARFYGAPYTVGDILEGKVRNAPQNAIRPLWQTLYAAEGRPEVLGTEAIPQGLAPGEIDVSAEEAKQLQAEAEKEGGHNAGQGVAASTSKGTRHFVPPPLAPHTADGAHPGPAASASQTEEPPAYQPPPGPPPPTSDQKY